MGLCNYSSFSASVLVIAQKHNLFLWCFMVLSFICDNCTKPCNHPRRFCVLPTIKSGTLQWKSHPFYETMPCAFREAFDRLRCKNNTTINCNLTMAIIQSSDSWKNDESQIQGKGFSTQSWVSLLCKSGLNHFALTGTWEKIHCDFCGAILATTSFRQGAFYYYLSYRTLFRLRLFHGACPQWAQGNGLL